MPMDFPGPLGRAPARGRSPLTVPPLVDYSWGMRTTCTTVVAALLLMAGCSTGEGSSTSTTSTTAPGASATGTSSGTSTTATTPASPTRTPPRGTTGSRSATGPAPAPSTSSPSPSVHPSPSSRTTAAGPTLPPALRDGVVTRLPTSSRVVALTFDGGAGSQGAATILATLRAQGVPASFFVTGKFVTANPSTTRQMVALGPVGNHTWSHPDLTSVSTSTLQQELSTTRTAILASTGKEPRPLFRFPFGAYDSRVLGLVHAQGYGAVGWTTDSLGWKGTSGGMSVDSVVARVLAGRTPGQVVLMHVGANPDDGTTLDAAALPRIIAGYRAAGYGFTTLPVLMR